MSGDQERALPGGLERPRRDLLAGRRNGNGHVKDQPVGRNVAGSGTRSRPGEVVLLLSVEQVARALGLGRSKTYELIAAGELEVVHIGRCARVPVDSAEAYVDRLRRG